MSICLIVLIISGLLIFSFKIAMVFEPAHNNTHILPCVTSEDSDQPAYSCTLIRDPDACSEYDHIRILYIFEYISWNIFLQMKICDVFSLVFQTQVYGCSEGLPHGTALKYT